MEHMENPVEPTNPVNPVDPSNQAEQPPATEEKPERKTRYRRIWKTSDFFLDHGAILEYRANREIVCKVVDDHHVIIQWKPDSDAWAKKTLSGAMKVADKRVRGHDVGGKTTPPFQTKWMFEGETLEHRRLRILEEMANEHT